MQAVRFLGHLLWTGCFYQIKYPEHNYVRTLAQYKLYQEAKKAVPEMKAYICFSSGLTVSLKVVLKQEIRDSFSCFLCFHCYLIKFQHYFGAESVCITFGHIY